MIFTMIRIKDYIVLMLIGNIKLICQIGNTDELYNKCFDVFVTTSRDVLDISQDHTHS